MPSLRVMVIWELAVMMTNLQLHITIICGWGQVCLHPSAVLMSLLREQHTVAVTEGPVTT